MKHPVEIEIQELVLTGFPPLDRYRVHGALERELTALLAARPASGGVLPGERDALPGGTFELRAGSTPEDIGRQAARNLFGSLKGIGI